MVWRTTRNGRIQILDAEPHPDGTVLTVGATGCVTLSAQEIIDEAANGYSHELHRDHHATCPHANEWKRR